MQQQLWTGAAGAAAVAVVSGLGEHRRRRRRRIDDVGYVPWQLIQVLAIPLVLLGPNTQLIAVFVLGLLIWRAGVVIAGMRNGVAIAFALLCLMVLVVAPNALYIVFLQFPSSA